MLCLFIPVVCGGGACFVLRPVVSTVCVRPVSFCSKAGSVHSHALCMYPARRVPGGCP